MNLVSFFQRTKIAEEQSRFFLKQNWRSLYTSEMFTIQFNYYILKQFGHDGRQYNRLIVVEQTRAPDLSLMTGMIIPALHASGTKNVRKIWKRVV